MTGVGRCRRRSFVTHLRQSHISRTVWPTITKFYTNRHTGRFYNHTGYNDHYVPPEVILKKTSKIPPQTTWGGISRERFKRGSRNFAGLSRTKGPTILQDITLPTFPVECKMYLNTAQKCVKLNETKWKWKYETGEHLACAFGELI